MIISNLKRTLDPSAWDAQYKVAFKIGIEKGELLLSDLAGNWTLYFDGFHDFRNGSISYIDGSVYEIESLNDTIVINLFIYLLCDKAKMTPFSHKERFTIEEAFKQYFECCNKTEEYGNSPN